jgi:hypothetical protein
MRRWSHGWRAACAARPDNVKARNSKRRSIGRFWPATVAAAHRYRLGELRRCGAESIFRLPYNRLTGEPGLAGPVPPVRNCRAGVSLARKRSQRHHGCRQDQRFCNQDRFSLSCMSLCLACHCMAGRCARFDRKSRLVGGPSHKRSISAAVARSCVAPHSTKRAFRPTTARGSRAAASVDDHVRRAWPSTIP